MPQQVTLPDHLTQGRTTIPGPVTGGYITVCLVLDSVAAGLTGSDSDILVGFEAPFDLRVHRVHVYTRADGGGTATMQVQKNTTYTTTGATDLLTAALDVTSGSVSAGGNSGDDTTLVNTTGAERNLDRGDKLFCVFTTQATTGTLTDTTITITFHAKGHSNASPDND